MDKLRFGLDSVKFYINGCFCDKEPWQTVVITSTSVLAGVWFWHFIFQDESVGVRSKHLFFNLVKKIPMVSNKIKTEKDNLMLTFEKEVAEKTKGVPYIVTLPKQGLPSEEIINLLKQHLELGSYDWKDGFVSGAVYYQNKQLMDLMTEVYGMASYTNPLHSDVFPGVCKMEAEVVRICATLFHGGVDSCGTMTTGGTESIMMACKAYRDYGRSVKGIKKAQILLPTTAHPAFHKASMYFAMNAHQISVDPNSYAVNLMEMESYISKNTVMLVGSVPNYPYGTMDNIEGIAALGRKYNIPVHVDCCLGGFLTAFMPQAGFSIPKFNFAVDGVTSISADTHKYGFSPKGSSVILYSDKKYLHHQYSVTTDWPGGVYGSPTVNGSRSGGVIAASWAALLHFGLDGYVGTTKKIVETTKYIEKELRALENIFIFGTPITSVIAIGSNQFHIYRLTENLNAKGWNLNALQFPPGVHICVTHLHTQEGVADRFLNDVKSAIEEIMKNPDLKVEGKMAMYGMTQRVPDRSIVGDFIRLFIDSNYLTPNNKEPIILNGYKQS